jgi:hypothetical protein
MRVIQIIIAIVQSFCSLQCSVLEAGSYQRSKLKTICTKRNDFSKILHILGRVRRGSGKLNLRLISPLFMALN